MLLRLLGYEAQVARTGPEGVQAAKEWTPDVVLCDIGLPGLDGYGVARELRLHPTTARTRLLALTGYGSDEDRRRSREAGFDLHLTSPWRRTSFATSWRLRGRSAERGNVVACVRASVRTAHRHGGAGAAFPCTPVSNLATGHKAHELPEIGQPSGRWRATRDRVPASPFLTHQGFS